jgi:phospholipid/cholesterol/gamma-HCH transport system ATP-binding protein
MSSSHENAALLALNAARVPVDPRFGEFATIDLSLQAGELILIDPGRPAAGAALADSLCGINPVESGEIRFLGRAWWGLPPDAANALRGRIGRIFIHGGWLEHLSVLENVLLQQLHHTRRERELLLQDATRLAQRLGLPGLPAGRPYEHTEPELRRAGCVRAFLGRPALLLLEEPIGSAGELLTPLLNLAVAALSRGAAVVWLTSVPAVLRDPNVPCRDRYRLLGGQLVDFAEQAA